MLKNLLVCRRKLSAALFYDPILGSRYGLGVSSREPSGHAPTFLSQDRRRTSSPYPPSDNLGWPDPLPPSTLTTPLAIPDPSSSSSNGPG